MPKRRLALVAAVVLALLLCLPFAFMLAKPAHVTFHLAKATPSGDTVIVSLVISNEVEHFGTSGLFPVSLERMEGAAWKECPGGVCEFSLTDPAYATRLTCVIKRLPGSLRLVTQRRTDLTGLQSLELRARLWLSGNRNISLNPFDRRQYTKVTEFVSEPFVLP
jgi:hypothetical protein